ncbi:MAG: undecaprenyl-diphosphatase, partial [Chloroflexota bacterium]
ERLGARTRPLNTLTWPDAFIVGLAQALAILPGISRSGATIAAGLGRHLDRAAAARFSFLLSIPALLGAGLVALKDLADAGNTLTSLPVLVT